ncbi:MAG: TonB-dependent siderophore receptor [Azoarcus sp.]|jgi:outer membrane receptor for ferric coprogen and ferric-rhodotorulic acid|nr:TonB-dependent siderophore receptor [Azoarcus sp.]
MNLIPALRRTVLETALEALCAPHPARGFLKPPPASPFPIILTAFLGVFSIGIAQAQDAASTSEVSSETSGEVVLPEVTVQSTGENPAVTEGSGAYTTPQMSTATKLPLSIRETPQSVTVITRQRIEDQNMVTISDAMQNTPGIVISTTGPQRDRFNARGFNIDNITFDGLPISFGTYGPDFLLADTAIYDRIEIVRGAAGLAQGAGNPSAAINLVRKRPTRDPHFRLSGNTGNWDRYGMEADIGGPLNTTGTLRARAVAAYQDHDSFQDVASSKRKIFYFIAEADIARDTLLTLSATRQENDNTSTWGGLPVAADGSDLKLSRSTFLGNDWEYWNKDSSSAFASLEQRFDNLWKLNFSVNYVRARLDSLASYVTLNTGSGQYDQVTGNYPYLDRRTSYEFHASGPFHLLNRSHELVLGLSRRNGEFHGYGGSTTTFTGMDIYNWKHDAPKPVINLNAWLMHTDEEQTGAYLTTRLNLADPLKLILGARLDWYEFTNRGLASVSSYKVSRNLTQYAGLIYDLDKSHSIYASYTDIFKPQNNYDISGNLLEPVVGKNYEIGLKGEYFGGALNASAAVFRVDQEKLAMRLDDQSVCPSYPAIQCYRAAGLVRSEGLDLEIQGELTPDWQLGAGYTFVYKETRKDANPANVGQRASTELPRHQFKLFSAWRYGPWRMGGGVNWQSDIYYKRTGFHSRQDAYAIANLMAGYRFGKALDIQLNINNLFDKTYCRSITSSAFGSSVYGEPRSIMLTAKYSFF